MINNSDYGGFVVSNNILQGVMIRYSYREQSNIEQLNGWNLLSVQDDDDYVKDPKNFTIINATTLYGIAPQMLEIFDAPYGTDLFWIYENGVHIGFYDLCKKCEVSIEQILKG